MPRPFCRRRVGCIPASWRFSPEGIRSHEHEVLTLTLDELEALRLADLLGLYHEEAARQMGISRATFGRILETARKKVAEALVSGKGIKIDEGPVELVAPPEFGRCHRWRHGRPYGGIDMSGERHGRRQRLGLGPEGSCVCPQCGFKKAHQPGVPCLQERCPHCGSALVREGSPHHQLIKERKAKKEE